MKKVKIGFVGAGWMGSVQMKRICERNDAEILALFEKSETRGKEVLRELGLSENLLVDDFQKILNNPEINTVWLVSPNSFHGPQAVAALEFGKNVFCEKPAATKFRDYVRQIELEKQTGLKTFVDYILNFDTMERDLRKMITDGVFGDITQVQVNYRHPVNIAGDKVWKLSKEIMGDAIGMGINHAISVMVLMMESQGRPCGVFATSQSAKVRGFETDPIWNIMVKFTNGATGFCFGNIDSANGYDAYHNVFGTKGAFVFESQLDRPQKIRLWSEKLTDGKWIYPLDAARCERENVLDLAWPEDTTTPDSGNVVEHQTGQCVGHFIECVKNDVPSPLSFVNSRIIAEIGWAAQMSAKLGREIQLPLNIEEAKKFFEANE